MRECLWKVTECVTRLRVDLLGKEAHIVGKRQDVAECLLCRMNVAATCQIVDGPETADTEGALG